MATGKVIGRVEVSVGNVKIIGVDGVPREPEYGGTVYEGEQIISVDPEALFQVKYSALPESTAYDGLFRVLADGSVIAGTDVMDSLASDENLMDIFNLETAAGEEALDSNSRFTPSDIVAESSVQGFGRGPNPGLSGLDGVDVGTAEGDINDNAPTAEDAYNTAMEDNPNAVTGQLSGHDADNNPFHFVLVEGPSEGSLILLPDGRYIYYVEDDFQDLGVGETRDVTFTYKTVETYTPEGFESEPATVTITVAGTNDQPVVLDINVNGDEVTFWHLISEGANLGTIQTLAEMSISNSGSYPTDGSAIKFIVETGENESVSFNWDFMSDDYLPYNDFSFVIIDGVLMTLEDIGDADVNGNTLLSHTFSTAGTHTIIFGVMNSGDTSVDSVLNVQHVSGGELLDMQIVGNVSEEVITAAAIIYETNDDTDAPLLDDTTDDGNNVLTGVLSVYDVDTNDTHTFEVVKDSLIISDPANAGITADDVSVSIELVDGEWNYVINGNFTVLANGESMTLTFQYVAIDDSGVGIYPVNPYDESDTSEPATITLTITGTNDQPIVYEVPEGAATIIEVLNGANNNEFFNLLSVTDDDSNDTHTFHLVGDEQEDEPQYDEPTLYASSGGSGGNSGWVAATVTDDSGEELDISAKVKITDEDTGAFKIHGNFNALAEGETATVTFYYYAVDNNEMEADGFNETSTSEPKLVTVTIIGTNDQPKVHNIDFGETNEALNGMTTINGDFDFDNVRDDDVTDTHTFEFVSAGKGMDIFNDPRGNADDDAWTRVHVKTLTKTDEGMDEGKAWIAVKLPDGVDIEDISFKFIKIDGEDFTLKGDFNALAEGETLTIKVRYVAVDDSGVGANPTDGINESDTSNSHWITMTVEGTNDAPEITYSTNPNIFNGLNGEYYGIGSQIHNLADFQAKIIEKEPDATFRATNIDYGELGITTHNFSNGDTYHVSTDESLQTFLKGDAHTLSADPGNTSDGGVRLTGQVELDAGDYTFKILSDDGYQIIIDGTAVAKMNANQSPQTHYHSFSIESDGYHSIEIYWWDQGIEYIFQPELKMGDGDYLSFSSENFNFTAEAAASVIEAGTTDSGVVVDGLPTVSGDLDATDEDNGALLTWSVVNPSDTYGTFVIDPNTGTWTYTLNNDLAATEALNENQIVTEVFNVLVTDEYGATDTHPVVVEIQGTNDAPTLSVFGGDNLVVNGSFENPDISSGTWAHLATGVPGWVAADQVELWDHLSTYGYDASDGEQHVELDYNGVVDTLSQTLNLVEGKFILSFDAATRDAATKDNAFIVLWNGVQIASIAEEDMHETDGTWKTFTFEVDAVDGANTLMFAEESSDNYGPLLDNIQLYAATSFNETTSGIVGNVVGDDVDAGAVLTYSLINDYGIFDIDSDGSIFVKDGQSLDYEVAQSYILDVKVTDQFDASATQSVKVDVNDITATVAGGEDVDLVVHTFNGHGKWSNEGWTGSGNESGVHSGSTPNGILGWFTQDGDTRSHDFTLNGAAGDTATISFTVGVHGDAEGYNKGHNHTPYGEGWEGNDALVVTVTGNNGLVAEETFYLDSNDEHMDTFSRSFDITVPNDGDIEVTFSSANTIDHGQGKESWFIDDFKIEGPEGDQIVSFENSSEGAIDMAELVEQANDFDFDNDTSTIETGIPDSVDEIDLSVGDHDLSNITLSDVIELSDGDNVLKITGDAGDSVDITSNGWIIDTAPSVTETGYDTYTNTADSSVQLLIDIDIPIEVD